MAQPHLLKIGRLEALTDGIFAIAMTILILNLSLPTDIGVSSFSAFLMTDILFKLFIYIGSFIILGTLWIGMHFQIGLLEHINRPYLWTHIIYLMAICVIPFSASLVGAYPNREITITFFAINLLCASTAQLIICQTAHYFRLNSGIYSAAVRRALIQRIAVGPILYITAIIVAHWNTQLAFILLITPILIYLRPGRIDSYDA